MRVASGPDTFVAWLNLPRRSLATIAARRPGPPWTRVPESKRQPPHRQKKILEAAQRRTSLKKCRRDLREYNIPLAALLSEDGIRTSSRREMEIITERLYTNLFRSSTPVSSPIIPIGEALPRILPSEVRVAIKSIKPGTAPDLISYQQTSFGLMAIYFV
ncbi:hypothetical protein RB195_023101 [Necator americanus]|uniref:Uncharacterized protein n=1 Tax=Necator americanus TaxID=51031 RepID=A0ABR1EHU4_NECAM